jgi:Coiled-coil domain containing protein (DUF2052)
LLQGGRGSLKVFFTLFPGFLTTVQGVDKRKSVTKMEVDESDSGIEDENTLVQTMIKFLSKSPKAYFKSQQNTEPELTFQQKQEVLEETLAKSHATFLSRYGIFLADHPEYLRFFENQPQYTDDQKYEVNFYLKQIRENNSSSKIKNRRYRALQEMLEADDEYFSELEMMNREPALFNQLIGQYMSEDEKRMRDNNTNDTFVDIMFKNIDHDRFRTLQKQQENTDVDEDDTDCEEVKVKLDPESEPNVASSSRKLWGNFEDDNNAASQDGMCQRNFNEAAQSSLKPLKIEISERDREFLREEFVGIIYSNFLAGRDTDFDYSLVDQNVDYDDLVQVSATKSDWFSL